MAERRTVIFTGIEAAGLGSIEEQVKKELGIDIKNNPQYEVTWNGFSDNEGISETGYTEFKVERVIPDMGIQIDPVQPKPNPIKPEPPKPAPENLATAKEDELKEKIQDMLDKYYGNPKKEKEYRKRIKRFKSHIVDNNFEYVDESGKKQQGKYKTIEDYPEKQEDEKFLQLEDYAFKLERLSRAEVGDIELYRVSAKEHYKVKVAKYKHAINTTKDEAKKKRLITELKNLEENKEESIQKDIRILQGYDQDYLETNNFAYNQHQTTQSNLMTLGKYGEQVPYLKMSEGKGIKKVAKNIVKGMANVWLFGRNKIAAPIDKAIGTYVAAPIHRILYNSEKNSVGVYKGIASHRYTARKDYFTDKYMQELKKENEEREANGLKPKQPSIMKLVFGVRKDAMTQYKEGNIAIASAGATDLEKDFQRIENGNAKKEAIENSLQKAKDNILVKVGVCKEHIRTAQNEDEKLDWVIALKEATTNLLEVDKRMEDNRLRHIDSLRQTDAISMAQHDKANKSNVTRVVSGIKSAARMVAMRFIGKNLSKEIAERTTEEKWVPEQTVTKEEIVPGGISTEKLEDLTMEDLMNASKADTVSYYSGGGRVVDKPGELFARGLSIKLNDGSGSERIVSISDGLGFDIAGRTDFKIDAISNESKTFDVISELMTKAGKPTTAKELAQGIANSSNPQEALSSLLESVSPWAADNKIGMPDGWLDMSGAGKVISENMLKDQIRTVTEVVPGHMETVVSESMRRVIDSRVVAAEVVLAAGGARDLYELGRRTKSKEEMQKEGTHKEPLKSYEKNSYKPKKREYDNNKWGFDGTKKGDFASLYDESKLGENKAKRGSGMDR